MWIDPKTNWVSTDYFNYSDYNRIKNNIAHLRNLSLSLYINYQYEDMGDDKSGYSEFPYADEFNAIEDNLEIIKKNTYDFYNSDKKQWHDNMRTPDYEDFNRLESACLKMYIGLNKQIEMKNRLSIRLGKRGAMN